MDSRFEVAVYADLKEREKRGELKILQYHPKVTLTKAEISYKPDFLIEENGQEIFLEVKGIEGERWRIIKKLWAFYGTKPLRIYKGDYRRFKVVEEIIPDGTGDV